MDNFFFSLFPLKVLFSVFTSQRFISRLMQPHLRTQHQGCIYLWYSLFQWVESWTRCTNLRMLFSETEVSKVSPCPSDCSGTNFVSMPEFWVIVLKWKQKCLWAALAVYLWFKRSNHFAELENTAHKSLGILMCCTFDGISYFCKFLMWPLLIGYIFHNGLLAVSKSHLHDKFNNRLDSANPILKGVSVWIVSKCQVESWSLLTVSGWEALDPNCVICDHSAKKFLQMSLDLLPEKLWGQRVNI